MGRRTAGDLMFEAYAQESGYELSAHEPDLGRTKRPDYVLARATAISARSRSRSS